MLPLCLVCLLSQSPVVSPQPAKAPTADLKPLGFYSGKFPFTWNTMLPLNAEVNGLKLNTIFFNVREGAHFPVKDVQFGTRAQIEVTNTSAVRLVPGFAVAVFDAEGRLLGVGSGGYRFWGGLGPGETSHFDLEFNHVKERLSKGATFTLSVEFGT